MRGAGELAFGVIELSSRSAYGPRPRGGVLVSRTR